MPCHTWNKIMQAFFCAHISISTLSRFSEKLGFCSFGTGFLEIWNWVLPNLADFLKNFMGELGFWPFWNWVFGWELGFSKIWWSGFFKIPNWVFGFCTKKKPGLKELGRNSLSNFIQHLENLKFRCLILSGFFCCFWNTLPNRFPEVIGTLNSSPRLHSPPVPQKNRLHYKTGGCWGGSFSFYGRTYAWTLRDIH